MYGYICFSFNSIITINYICIQIAYRRVFKQQLLDEGEVMLKYCHHSYLEGTHDFNIKVNPQVWMVFARKFVEENFETRVKTNHWEDCKSITYFIGFKIFGDDLDYGRLEPYNMKCVWNPSSLMLTISVQIRYIIKGDTYYNKIYQRGHNYVNIKSKQVNE